MGQTFWEDMSTYTDIRTEIDRLSEKRVELWRSLGESGDQELRLKVRALDERIAKLWDEHRAERARIRFGDPKSIVARARTEERLERAA